MSEPQDHHFNPKFYLREWCEGKPKLPYFTRQNGKVVKSEAAPRSTGFVWNLYSLRNVPKKNRQFLEKEFFNKQIDERAYPVFKQLLLGGLSRFTKEDRVIWTRYLIAAAFRVPGIVEPAKIEGTRRAIEGGATVGSQSTQAVSDMTDSSQMGTGGADAETPIEINLDELGSTDNIEIQTAAVLDAISDKIAEVNIGVISICFAI